jgi:hypothetical protein
LAIRGVGAVGAIGAVEAVEAVEAHDFMIIVYNCIKSFFYSGAAFHQSGFSSNVHISGSFIK